jgi:hypothetical protein
MQPLIQVFIQNILADHLLKIFDIVDINDKLIGQSRRKGCNSGTESLTTTEKGGLDGDPKSVFV